MPNEIHTRNNYVCHVLVLLVRCRQHHNIDRLECRNKKTETIALTSLLVKSIYGVLLLQSSHMPIFASIWLQLL